MYNHVAMLVFEILVVDFEGVSNLFVAIVLVAFVYNNQCQEVLES